MFVCIALVCGIIGNIIYTLYGSPIVPVMGRLFVGASGSLSSVAATELTRIHTVKENYNVQWWMITTNCLGMALGSFVNLCFTDVNTKIGGFLVLNSNNVVGIFMAALYLLLLNIVILFAHDCKTKRSYADIYDDPQLNTSCMPTENNNFPGDQNKDEYLSNGVVPNAIPKTLVNADLHNGNMSNARQNPITNNTQFNITCPTAKINAIVNGTGCEKTTPTSRWNTIRQSIRQKTIIDAMYGERTEATTQWKPTRPTSMVSTRPTSLVSADRVYAINDPRYNGSSSHNLRHTNRHSIASTDRIHVVDDSFSNGTVPRNHHKPMTNGTRANTGIANNLNNARNSIISGDHLYAVDDGIMLESPVDTAVHYQQEQDNLEAKVSIKLAGARMKALQKFEVDEARPADVEQTGQILKKVFGNAGLRLILLTAFYFGFCSSSLVMLIPMINYEIFEWSLLKLTLVYTLSALTYFTLYCTVTLKRFSKMCNFIVILFSIVLIMIGLLSSHILKRTDAKRNTFITVYAMTFALIWFLEEILLGEMMSKMVAPTVKPLTDSFLLALRYTSFILASMLIPLIFRCLDFYLVILAFFTVGFIFSYVSKWSVLLDIETKKKKKWSFRKKSTSSQK